MHAMLVDARDREAAFHFLSIENFNSVHIYNVELFFISNYLVKDEEASPLRICSHIFCAWNKSMDVRDFSQTCFQFFFFILWPIEARC